MHTSCVRGTRRPAALLSSHAYLVCARHTTPAALPVLVGAKATTRAWLWPIIH
jgi:hypothetical protein